MQQKIAFLGVITFALLLADIVLCLCISFAIPRWLTHPADFVYDDGETTKQRCGCDTWFEYALCGPREDVVARTLSVPPHAYDYGRKGRPLKFDPVVAVNVLRPQHPATEFRFVCAGVAISKQWILTGAKCLTGLHDFRHVVVRIRSWKRDRGGLVYDVRNIVKSHFGVAAIQTQLPLPLRAIRVATDYGDYYHRGALFTIGWDASDGDRVRRTQYAVRDKCRRTRGILSRDSCSGVPAGTPIVYNGTLFGLVTCTSHAMLTFTDFDAIDAQNWLRRLLAAARPKAYKTHVRRGYVYCESRVDAYDSRIDDFVSVEPIANLKQVPTTSTDAVYPSPSDEYKSGTFNYNQTNDIALDTNYGDDDGAKSIDDYDAVEVTNEGGKFADARGDVNVR